MSSSIYSQMSSIEHGRQKEDIFYHILVNSEAKTLDDICKQIVTHLKQTYDETKMSTRLKQMLLKVCQNEDRVGKHALVFYALHQEPTIQEIFMSDTPKVPPEKFNYFLKNELPKLVDKLVKGAFTSLRAFVEDARWTYTTL